MAAVLDAGRHAAASHRSAAALWRLPGFRLDAFDVVWRHDGDHHRVSLGRLHTSRLLPTTTSRRSTAFPSPRRPARTLFDLAGILDPRRTERAVDNALAKSPALLGAVHRTLPVLAERGRTGITVMRAILDARPAGYIAPASGVEARVIGLLDEAGIATRRQVDIGGDDWIGRVDLLVVGTRLVIEVDSARFHTSKLDRERDARRDVELRTAGYDVLHIAEGEAWHQPTEMVRRVLAAVRCAA